MNDETRRPSVWTGQLIQKILANRAKIETDRASLIPLPGCTCPKCAIRRTEKGAA